jgi:hypothetical protein
VEVQLPFDQTEATIICLHIENRGRLVRRVYRPNQRGVALNVCTTDPDLLHAAHHHLQILLYDWTERWDRVASLGRTESLDGLADEMPP